jgi:hypothetical protein
VKGMKPPPVLCSQRQMYQTFGTTSVANAGFFVGDHGFGVRESIIAFEEEVVGRKHCMRRPRNVSLAVVVDGREVAGNARL